jgi:hypothetical protein
MAEAPWNNYYGRQMSARDMSNLLGTFGIESQNVRLGDQVRKGYRSQDLWDAWHRYA